MISNVLERLGQIQLERTFNPYADVDPIHDRPNAPAIRRENLVRFLRSFHRPRLLLVGEAPGYRGMRRTGVPMTCETLLYDVSSFFGATFEKATKTGDVSELTAKMVWEVLFKYNVRALLWNAVMVQPVRGNGKNRAPRREEVRIFLPVLSTIVKTFNPSLIVAVGRVADYALRTLDVPHVYVRHPAHGGKKKFIEAMDALLTNL